MPLVLDTFFWLWASQSSLYPLRYLMHDRGAVTTIFKIFGVTWLGSNSSKLRKRNTVTKILLVYLEIIVWRLKECTNNPDGISFIQTFPNYSSLSGCFLLHQLSMEMTNICLTVTSMEIFIGRCMPVQNYRQYFT